jgi:hypothetical protein
MSSVLQRDRAETGFDQRAQDNQRVPGQKLKRCCDFIALLNGRSLSLQLATSDVAAGYGAQGFNCCA